MILHDTPYGLVARVMRDEAEKVDFFRKKEGEKVLKKLKREYVDYPFYHKAEYTVPQSRNKYIVWFYSKGRWDTNLKYGNFLEIYSQNGGRTVFFYKTIRDGATFGHNQSQELAVYTDHFFRRYRERSKTFASLLPTDLIVRYFSRNYYHIEGLDFEKLNFNHEKYTNGSVHQVEDGLVFVTLFDADDGRGCKCPVIKHNTFVSYDLLKDEQQGHVLGDDDIRRGLLREFGEGLDRSKYSSELDGIYETGKDLERIYESILAKHSSDDGFDLSKINIGLANLKKELELIKKEKEKNSTIR